MAKVELSLMTGVGRMFCAECYRFKVDSLNMLIMYLILENVEETI